MNPSTKIGIDNYGLFPLDMAPIETLQWAVTNGADGVAFSGLEEKHRVLCQPDYLKEMKAFADDHNLYLEWGGGQHFPIDLNNWEVKKISQINQQAAEEAQQLGTPIIRSCSGGLMRWNPESLATKILMERMAEELSSQLQMLRDYQVVLAIETHFELTTFEILQVFDWCGVEPGDCLGICLDTMNLLTMLEDPVMATERVIPWVVSTHIKDGGIIMTDQGLRTFTTPIGKGVVDIRQIARMLLKNNPCVNLNIEDHGGSFELPVYNPAFLQEFPDLSAEEMVSIFKLAGETKTKMDQHQCHILDRSEWPDICDQRMADNLLYLKTLLNG